ncbi:TKL family protein kinase [Trichomonas vaginalis G3]|uniref:TKL family protein kinase n=1 Tax=Trichomonas vaginalis (strain ATCC PRA-98 / G3) TaxID=412133 RepID=A2DRQ2_TRIV3|nr:protein kinase protein [Trichomonas vaginalis G3]EAY16849.1 TKL family protein kinase [Trichomonas vaginalis G3]KAI5489162.1 protein kinase protein [Trichomonas vaginalis G3]|eukprot:XP_001329072.1 TKL family protein kinase [Trichomonas vaginalis G3]
MTDTLENLCRDLPNFLVQRSDFQYEKKIGGGSFGDVYLAKYIPTGQMTAVKELKHETLEEPFLQYFLREIRILAKCDNYFLLHFTGYTATHPFLIVTEYIQNGSLFDSLHDQTKSLDGTQKTIIALGIACGMARLHSFNIMHRDLKSLNILLDESYFPRICDFGASRIKSAESELVTQNIGTVHWMAPEMFDSTNYTLAVDVYAYAILLWELLAEEIPYNGYSVPQIMRTVCMNDQRLTIPQGTPPNLAKLIQLCWNRDPEKRPPFDRIFKIFKSHKVSFPGCVDSKVDEALASIEAKAAQLQSHGIVISGIPTNISGVPNSQNQPSFDTESLYRIVTSGDSNQIEQHIKQLTPETCSFYFDCVFKCISQQNPTNITVPALIGILKLIVMNQDCLTEFVKRNLQNSLPFDKDEHVKLSLSILLPIFEISPKVVTTELVQKLEPFIPKFGFKICRLISVFCSNFTEVGDPWKVSDILILKAGEFIQAGASIPLMETLFGLLSRYDFFREARLQNCIPIYLNRMMSNIPDEIITSYNCLNGLQVPQLDVDPLIMATHLDNANISKFAIQFLAKNPIKRVNPMLIEAISLSQFPIQAIQALCRCAMISPKDVLDKSSLWLANPKFAPDLQLTCLMTITLKEDLRKIVATNPNMVSFLNSCLSGNPSNDVLSSLSTLMRVIPFDSQTVMKLGETGFLKNYIKLVTAANNMVVYSNCFLMIDYLCRISFLIDSLDFAPTALQLMKVPELQKYAIYYLLLLSSFEVAAASLKKLNTMSVVDSIQLTPDVKKLAEDLRHNLFF